MTSPERMTCRDVESAIGAVLSGDFTRDEFVRANRHIAECSACLEQFAALGEFRAAFREVYGVARPAKRAARRYGRQVGWAVALAAAIVAALFVMVSGKNPTEHEAVGPNAPVIEARAVMPPPKSVTTSSPVTAVPAVAPVSTRPVAAKPTTHAAHRTTPAVLMAKPVAPVVPPELEAQDLTEIVAGLTDEELLNLVS